MKNKLNKLLILRINLVKVRKILKQMRMKVRVRTMFSQQKVTGDSTVDLMET
jgi:hypothetical protein